MLCNNASANKSWQLLSHAQQTLLWTKYHIGARLWYVLLTQAMLFDVHIQAAYDLVRIECPNFEGMAPVCIQRSSKDKMKPVQNFGACILHCDPSLHWILLVRHRNSSIACVYDSLGIHYNKLIRRSIAELFYPFDNKPLNIEYKACHQQTNGVDCGLFAIANLFNIVKNINPMQVTYNIPLMRGHFKDCIVKEKFALFPIIVYPNNYTPSYYFSSNANPYASTSSSIRINKPTKYSLGVICDCQLPWEYRGEEIRCFNCKKYFHKRCVGMENSINNNGWTCYKCNNSIKNLQNGVTN